MARKLNLDGAAVGHAVMVILLEEPEVEPCLNSCDVAGIAEHLLDAAEVEFQPRARKLILTFDLSGEPGSLEVPRDLTPMPDPTWPSTDAPD